MPLVFDIETIGEDFEQLDQITLHMLTKRIKKNSLTDKEYQAEIEAVKNDLGFSPLTGEIVAIGMLDSEKEKGCVYFQTGKEVISAFEEMNMKYKPASEKEMLLKFWELANLYKEFVSFNGRGFDVPFLMIRSAINKIKPTKNLISNRYLNSQRFDANHIDLFDQLTFYGTFRPKGNSLHMWTRAFGIESPKSQGVDGEAVAELFRQKEYIKIAKYNALDIKATAKLYRYWDSYIRM
jgi:predicted PolB exonuclease-like 3'-5' exonuclease